MRIILAAVILIAAIGTTFAQTSTNMSGPVLQSPQFTVPVDAPVEVRGDGFHRAFSKALRKSARDGSISRRDSLRIRVAMLSPAFRAHAENLAVVQMAFSGDDGVPFDDDGRVDRASIDWDGLIAFLERLIPLILQLMDLFGA